MFVEILEKWNSYLEMIPKEKRDIYYTEEYARMAVMDNTKPLCIVCKEDNNVLLMPFLRGNVSGFYDFETPYGYGGPITNTTDKEWLSKAFKELKEKFYNEKYVAGFIRFHPLLNNADICREYFKVIDDRKTLAIDTSISTDDIWMSEISSKNRNMIRKAEKNGLVYERDNDFKYLDKFISLYNVTMDRLDAESFYYFGDEYYKEFKELFKNKGFLGVVKLNDEVICAALFMYDNDYGHYHLAGSNREYSSLGGNNLMLWKTACELHNENVKQFHLGGGTTSSEEDPLFKFKKSFTKNEKQFSIGKVIFNEQEYNNICEKWELANPDKVEKYKRILLKYKY